MTIVTRTLGTTKTRGVEPEDGVRAGVGMNREVETSQGAVSRGAGMRVGAGRIIRGPVPGLGREVGPRVSRTVIQGKIVGTAGFEFIFRF